MPSSVIMNRNMKVRSRTALPAASDNEREGGLGKRKRETDRGALEAGVCSDDFSEIGFGGVKFQEIS